MMRTNEDLLDRAHHALRGLRHEAEGERTMRELFEGLRSLRNDLDDGSWNAFVERANGHALRGLVHEDPMARRSFEKPRGYAGDAVLLDYIYLRDELDEVSPLGRAVNRYAAGRPSACAVRHRRDWLAFQIDRAADRAAPAGARVFSVACGHLREAELSSAIRSGALRELVALDADPESLNVVRESGFPNVSPVQQSIGRMLARPDSFGTFDLIYSAGLYDYLEPGIARRLTRRLFDQLEPGGRLVFTNFLRNVSDAAYMETFMGWELLLRDLDEIHDLTRDVSNDEVASRQVFEDPFGAIGYCVLSKGYAPR